MIKKISDRLSVDLSMVRLVNIYDGIGEDISAGYFAFECCGELRHMDCTAEEAKALMEALDEYNMEKHNQHRYKPGHLAVEMPCGEAFPKVAVSSGALNQEAQAMPSYANVNLAPPWTYGYDMGERINAQEMINDAKRNSG